MSEALKINQKALKEFLALCTRAEKLGLQVLRDKKKELMLRVGKDGEIGVEVNLYDLTDQNGYGQGHTMITVYTKEGVNALMGHIDLHIADDSKIRYTEVSKSWNLFRTDDLTAFIRKHSKSPINAKERKTTTTPRRHR